LIANGFFATQDLINDLSREAGKIEGLWKSASQAVIYRASACRLATNGNTARVKEFLGRIAKF
jgi:hypothetical protein